MIDFGGSQMKSRATIAVLAACLCSAAADAAPRVNVDRVRPRFRTQAAASGPSCATDSTNCKLTYYGGHVIPNAKIYRVDWTAAADTSTTANISDFLQKVSNSAYLDWLAEYDTNVNDFAGNPGTGQLIGRGVYAGLATITPTVNTTSTLDDADIVDELKSQIAVGALPAPDDDTIYMTFFPPGTSITQGGSQSCISGGFCAYHGAFTLGGKSVYYAVMPDQGTGSGCDLGCGSLTATTGHELTEAITDAEVSLASQDAPPLGWYADLPNNTGGEIADICDGAPTGTISGYTVQALLSNHAADDRHRQRLRRHPHRATGLLGGDQQLAGRAEPGVGRGGRRQRGDPDRHRHHRRHGLVADARP